MEITKRKLMIGARFLNFVLEDESYCLEILKVKELLGMTTITPIPQTPAYIKGVINLRGQIIPIVDLRLKFGMEPKAYHKRTSIIVVEVDFRDELMLMGLIVDVINEVISIPKEAISAIPFINAKIKAEYIKGIATTAEGIKILLDVERVLNDEDFVLLKAIEK